MFEGCYKLVGGNGKAYSYLDTNFNIEYANPLSGYFTATNSPTGVTYYLRNVATNLYWGAANNWGTQASLVDEPQYVILKVQGDDTYTMETMASNGGGSYYFDGEYMDGSPVALTIKQLSNGNVTIGRDGILYGYDGSSSVLGRDLTDAESPNAQWMLLTQADIDAENDAVLGTATEEAPVDATFLIRDAGFGRNRRDAYKVWTVIVGSPSLNGGGNGANNAEAYMNAYETRQMLNVPKGLYRIDAQSLIEERERVASEFAKTGLIEVWPSDSNMLLSRLRMGKAKALKEFLAKEKGLLIRDASNFEGLDDGCFRIAVQNPEADDLLIEGIKEWIFSN